MSAARKGQYGLDAPYLLVLPVIVIVFDVWQAFATDLRHIARYRERLEALGMVDVSVRDLGWKMWWGGPWVPTKLVTASRA